MQDNVYDSFHPKVVYVHTGTADSREIEYPLRRVMFYELELIVEGIRGGVLTDGVLLPAATGTVFLRKPGMLVQADGAYRYYAFVFDSRFDPEYGEKYGIGSGSMRGAEEGSSLYGCTRNRSPLLDSLPSRFFIADIPRYLSCFERGFHFYLEHREEFPIYAGAELMQVMSMLLQERHKPLPSMDPALMHAMLKTKQYMDVHYAEVLNLGVLAGQASLCREHFCRCFKQAFGVSPMEYLLSVRMHYAKFLLTTTEKSVSEIVECCGFSSEQYFHRKFREQEGTNPTLFRRSSQ